MLSGLGGVIFDRQRKIADEHYQHFLYAKRKEEELIRRKQCDEMIAKYLLLDCKGKGSQS